jgi:hypothetical protein
MSTGGKNLHPHAFAMTSECPAGDGAGLMVTLTDFTIAPGKSKSKQVSKRRRLTQGTPAWDDVIEISTINAECP